ncbi:hypothetical protein BH20ACT15_BH20ACT15_04450 [soil metagenome]
MIWAAIAVLVVTIGVVSFIFFIRPRRYSRHAVLEVPGEATITLPAGEVGVFYEDAERWGYAERPKVADGLSLVVSDVSGTRVDLIEPETELAWKGPGKNRVPYGTLELPSGGSFRVTTRLSGEVKAPRLTFGDPV